MKRALVFLFGLAGLLTVSYLGADAYKRQLLQQPLSAEGDTQFTVKRGATLQGVLNELVE